MVVSQRVRVGFGRRAVALTLGTLLMMAGWPVTGAQGGTGHPGASASALVSLSNTSPAPSCDSSDSAFVRYLEFVYADLFGRGLDAQGLATWMSLLDRGGLQVGGWRAAVANSITSSVEFRTGLITKSYLQYLNRAPEPAGLDFWLAAMSRGWTASQIEAGFTASPEYYAQAGSTDSGWVTRLYADVLGRVPAASEVAWWTQALHDGMTRQGVSMGFLLSTEHLETVVSGYYEHLLQRSVDPSGRATWVGLLQAGARNETIIGGIVASTEYWDNATSPVLLVLYPESAVLTSGAGRTYVAKGFDCLVFALGDVTAATVFTVDGDAAACTGATCSPLAPGDHIVTGTLGRASGTAVLHVNPATGPVLYSMYLWGSPAFGGPSGASTADQPTVGMVGAETHWASAAAGGFHTVGIKTDGSLWAWGWNRYGQLGDGTTTDRPAPVPIGTDTHWASVVGGTSHTLAIKSDGTLWAWGDNSGGELGDGTTFNRSAPTRVGTDADWASVAAGGSHTLAIKSDGTLWAWGWNGYGQLGDGTLTQRSTPVQVSTDTLWAFVAAGSGHTTAIATNGTLWAWGYIPGTTVQRSRPVQVGTDTTWVSVAAGPGYGIALRP